MRQMMHIMVTNAGTAVMRVMMMAMVKWLNNARKNGLRCRGNGYILRLKMHQGEGEGAKDVGTA